MYNVSEHYIQSMAAPLREVPFFMVNLYNMDCKANAGLIISASGTPLQTGKNLNTIKVEKYVPRATFEQDYLLANGEYTTEDTDIFIGGSMSATTADANGLYSFTEPDSITVSHIVECTKPITFVLEKTIATVAVSVNDATEQIYTFTQSNENHYFEVMCYEGTITLRILAAFLPQRRPQIHGIYAASAIRSWDSNDIISIGFGDENDLVCLELPKRLLRIRINNLDSKYDVQSEMVSPTFSKNSTQCVLSFIYEGEYIPIGRFFLKNYKVYKEYIQFEFDWALQPLSEAEHILSRIGQYYAWERILEVLDPDSQIFLDVLQDTRELHPTYIYKLSCDISDVSEITTIINNPLPITSEASCLQLICNASGILMRPCRQDDDFTFFQRQLHGTNRSISYSELISDPEYFDVGEVASAEISYYDLAEATNEKISDSITVDTKKVYFKLSDPATTAASWVSTIKDPDYGDDIGLISYAAQGYALFVWVEMLDNSSYSASTGEITIDLQKVIETTFRQKNGSYEVGLRGAHDKKISNPLVDKSIWWQWWNKTEFWLNRNNRVTIKHRGYPELDCGDLVSVQLSPNGDYQRGWVTRNEWDFTKGYLSGTTELILYKEVGLG